MLVMTRRIGEKIMIGSNITLIVLGVQGNQVRIGVDAPRDVAVRREERVVDTRRTDPFDQSSIEPARPG